MKRLIITIIIFLLLILISSFLLFNLYKTQKSLLNKIDEISQCLDNDDKELAAEKSEELYNQWQKAEQVMLRYVRHASLDTVSAAIAKIQAYAKYEETGELRAELAEARVQIKHIWDAEKPTLLNML